MIKKLVTLFLLFLFTQLSAFPVYSVKDIGESAYFTTVRLKRERISARVIVIKDGCVLYNETSKKCLCEDEMQGTCEQFIRITRINGMPPYSCHWLCLSDPRQNHAYIAAIGVDGCFIDLKPILLKN